MVFRKKICFSAIATIILLNVASATEKSNILRLPLFIQG